jgi:AbrB family looped-hinge helix DNA binding protein
MTTLTQLSSKGQVVIPRATRLALGLRAGTRFRVRHRAGSIILDPISPSVVDSLYGRHADTDLLSEFEAEHRQEVAHETAVRA